MRNAIVATLMLGAASLPSSAVADPITQSIAGTRLDLNATGEVARIPDIAVISAGVVSRSTTASAALQDSADRMQRVLAALKRASVADRDIQTSNVNLNPEYRYPENQSPQLVGYTASNTLTVRFRDIRSSGRILDALVAQGRIRSVGRHSPSIGPRRRWTRRGQRPSPLVALGPTFTRDHWECASRGWSQSTKAADMARPHPCRR